MASLATVRHHGGCQVLWVSVEPFIFAVHGFSVVSGFRAAARPSRLPLVGERNRGGLAHQVHFWFSNQSFRCCQFVRSSWIAGNVRLPACCSSSALTGPRLSAAVGNGMILWFGNRPARRCWRPRRGTTRSKYCIAGFTLGSARRMEAGMSAHRHDEGVVVIVPVRCMNCVPQSSAAGLGQVSEQFIDETRSLAAAKDQDGFAVWLQAERAQESRGAGSVNRCQQRFPQRHADHDGRRAPGLSRVGEGQGQPDSVGAANEQAVGFTHAGIAFVQHQGDARGRLSRRAP